MNQLNGDIMNCGAYGKAFLKLGILHYAGVSEEVQSGGGDEPTSA